MDYQNTHESLAKLVHSYPSVFVLTDENTQAYCWPVVEKVLAGATRISIPAGEKNKQLNTYQSVVEKLVAKGIRRDSLLINLGGGMVTDLGGFVAATINRGCDYANIPTSLLAMVDAAIGGKTAVDLGNLKNIIGSFKLPVSNFLNLDFLTTLPYRQLINGWMEMVKHAAIDGEKTWQAFPSSVPEASQVNQWKKLVTESAAIKQKIVNADFKENNLRKILNFGHTIGHGIEAAALQSEIDLLHGEAIGFGMILESAMMNAFYPNRDPFHNQLLQKIEPHLDNSPLQKIEPERVWQYMQHDKKNLGIEVNAACVKLPGEYDLQFILTENLFTQTWKSYVENS